MDFILHAGAEHPNLAWIVIAAILSFIAGAGVGAYATLRKHVLPTRSGATDE